MSEVKLKTAVFGLDEGGKMLLKAASQIEHLQILAVADKDTPLAESVASQYNCSAYNDYRQLLMSNQIDCLLVADGMYSCAEYIKTAMKKKCNVLKLYPPARDFEEAAEFVRLAEENEVKYVIANPRRFADSFCAFRQYLQQGDVNQIFLLTAVCATGDKPAPVWQTDPKLAGGGVLLHDSYEIIDQLIWNFGTPQQVHGLNTNTAGDRQQRLYLTEDTAVVTMKFTDTLFGNLTASRSFGPSQFFIKLYAKDKTLTVSDTCFVVADALGQIIGKKEYEDDELVRMGKLLENFVQGIVSPDKNKLCSTARENLQNMAVIESAYLSARTSMPEQPGRILRD